MRKIILLSAVLICSSSAAFAQDAAAPETVVVTATRTPQPLDVTGTSMSVITAEDLKVQQTDVVSDILAETPGLTVDRTGGVGQPTSISLRGAEVGQTVVLIDGVRINDPSANDDSAVLGDLLVNNIDRIEVLRGPQSTLYGSDAIGGVVNILSKRGGDAPFAGTASVEGGSFDTYHGNVAADGTVSDIEYGAALNYYNTGGISAADERNGNTETDGYRNFGATANGRWHVADNLSVDLRGYYTSGRDDFDDNFLPPLFLLVSDSAAYNTNELRAGYAGVNLDLFGGMFHNRLGAIATSSTRDFFDSASDTVHLNYDYFGNTTRFEYQGVVDIDPADQVTFGAETQESSFRNDNFGINAVFSPPVIGGHDRISGYYAQAQSTLFDQLTLTGGVRLDDDAAFGTHTSLKFAGAWRIPGWDTTLRANYGDGFKAPTLYELFSQYRDPDGLAPETARGWEVGADHAFLDGRVRASLTYFARDTHNLIDFVSTSTPPFGEYENFARTRATGVEAEIAAHLTDTLSVSADYTNLSATDLATGLDLARRPRNSASTVITWLPLPKLTLGGSLVYVGPRFDDAAELLPLPSNTTVDLFGSYAVTERLEVFARVENLFDDLSEPVLGYGRMGRAVYGGVRTAF